MYLSTILIGTMDHKLFKLTGMLLAVNLAGAVPRSVADDTPGLVVPALGDSHRQYLSRIVRRTVRDAVLRDHLYEPDYVPRALQSEDAEVVVRLRQQGYLMAAGAGGPAPIARAARDAAFSACQTLRDILRADLDMLNDLLVEIEVVGPAEPIHIETDWTQPRALDRFIEPGVHGMVLVTPQGTRRFCPTELITSDMVLADALKHLAENTLSNPTQIPKTRLMRFRTVHWYQKTPAADIVSLHRGMVLVPPEAVSPQRLDESISRLAEYMAYRQLGSGLFAYQYQPAVDAYSDDNNLVRQVGAAVAMAVHAKQSGKSAPRAAATLAIRYHLQGLVDVPDVADAAFIATADKRNKLGVTALLALAMAEHPDAEQYADIRTKLINGMLWLQRPSGMFITAFPPAQQISAQEYFPGEALLAMATHYDHQPSSKITEAFDRAIAFYRGYFRGSPSPAFVPWQVQAYTLMAQHGKRQDYVDYVFELTDWLAARQLDSSNCPWPEMWGGIASYQPGRAGVATAAYLEGFADALSLAGEVGDHARVARYEKVVSAAARFVMQLQIRPEEAYFIRSPQDAVGGIRTSPALHHLRIDHCQHALVGLIKARRVLFPDTD